MSLFQFLNGNNYGTYNRPVAKKIGLNATVFLSELLDKYQHFHEKGEVISIEDEEGVWFYLTAEDVYERTSLSEREQRHSTEILVELGLIKKKVVGMPPRRHFQINENALEEFIKNQIIFTNSCKTPNQFLQNAKSIPAKRQITPYIKNPTEETKEEKETYKEGRGIPPDTPSASPHHSPPARELFDLFLGKLRERHPSFKQPNDEKWLKEFDLLLRVDKRDFEQVKQLILWAAAHKWWSTSCISAAKLRRSYDEIFIQMQSDQEKEDEKNRIKRNREYVTGALERFPDKLKHLKIFNKHITREGSGKDIELNLPFETFKNDFVNLFRGQYER